MAGVLPLMRRPSVIDNMENLAEVLRRSAQDRPNSVALRYRGSSMTYRELDRLSDRMAQGLRRLGVEPGDRVAILGLKSPLIVAALQAVLRADGVYVPLDPRAPTARLARICDDCGIETIVVDENAARHTRELSQGGRRAFFCTASESPEGGGGKVITREEIERFASTRLAMRRCGDDATYLLYTSGSTGQPKGVVISHHNALNFVGWAARHFGVGPDDRLLNHAPLIFDLPVFDLYNAFLAGATAVLLPETDAMFPGVTVRTIRDEQVTSLYLVPSAYLTLINRGRLLDLDPSAIRRLMYAGEEFPIAYLRRLRQWAPNQQICNLYGLNETNACTSYDLRSDDPAPNGSTVPIGTPIEGVSITLRDSQGCEVDASGTGEIYVTGACVPVGYWRNEELNRTRFVTIDGRVHLRTGDFARRDESGNLWFLGRKDAMVKCRGFTVELGEVEHALTSHPGVLEGAVVAVPDAELGHVLYAWTVTASGVGSSEIGAHLGSLLPTYMIPKDLFVVDALPKTGTGKTDRQELIGRIVAMEGQTSRSRWPMGGHRADPAGSARSQTVAGEPEAEAC